MSCDFTKLATPGVAGLTPYHPGKPVEELERELGIRDIIKLASNENPLGPGERVLDGLKTLPDLGRYPDGSAFRLRQLLAAKHDVEPNQLTIGNGSNDVLELVARTFVQPGDEVIYSDHAFAVYALATQAVSGRAVVIPALDYGHDLKAMAAAVTEHTRVIFIANPNNPTGTWLSAGALQQLLKSVPETVIVLIDEAYFEYADAVDYPDTSQWLADFPNLIVTRTFSKAYGLAALRIGYGLSHPQVADLLNRVRQPFNVNAVALLAAEIALGDAEHISQSIELNARGMEQLCRGFDSMGIHYLPSLGNFVCIDLEQPAQEIYQQLLQQGVIVRPIANYGMPNHLRISIGLEQE
ncbi:MAG: histidinol-phosphate transaminase, partial [Gammaproteobacteria bacterium]